MRVLSLAALLLVAGCTSSTEPDPGIRLAAHIVIVQGDSQVGTVHTALPQPLAVRVLDDNQRPIAGHAVAWRIVRGNGSTFAGYGVTDDSGRAFERWTLGDTSGTQTIEARAVDSTGTPIVFARIHATAQPGPLFVHGWPGKRLFVWLDSTVQIPLIARDRYGNTVSNPPPIIAAYDTARFGALNGLTVTPRDIGVIRLVAAPRFDTLAIYVLRGPALRWARSTGGSGVTLFTGIDSSMAGQCAVWCGQVVYGSFVFHQAANAELAQVQDAGTWRNLVRTDSLGWYYLMGNVDTLSIFRR